MHIHININIHIHTHIKINIHILIHTYINTHIHTHTFLVLVLGPKMSRAVPEYILENSYKVSTKCCLDKHIKALCKIEVLAKM